MLKERPVITRLSLSLFLSRLSLSLSFYFFFSFCPSFLLAFWGMKRSPQPLARRLVIQTHAALLTRCLYTPFLLFLNSNALYSTTRSEEYKQTNIQTGNFNSFDEFTFFSLIGDLDFIHSLIKQSDVQSRLQS